MFLWANAKEAAVAILFLVTLSGRLAFNVDTQFPILLDGKQGSYFGYTTALLRNKWGPLILVGAPKSNSSQFPMAFRPVREPGTLFYCNITFDGAQQPCHEVPLMREGAEEINRELYYQDMKDGMWLGASLDVNKIQNDVVTCGHLWRNKIRNGLHLTNGVCYVMNGELDTDSLKLVPLVEYERQFYTFRSRNEYNYAHGQAGISASYSEDGSNLILGAPGIWAWTGSVVDYSIISEQKHVALKNAYQNPSVPIASHRVEHNAYFGYSVTTGNFLRNRVQLYAIGAPRDGKNCGKFYIIRVNRYNNQMVIHLEKQGSQLGEYFGGSVLGMNLDDDLLTDLLVGAPTYSQDNGGDEGKVYVYKSTGNDLLLHLNLTGDNKVGARFGTTLANAGDINQDGFNDVAIGAPYEDDHGAIYIYHCSASGIDSTYAQKIEAAKVNPMLTGFGIHISRGFDIDQNGYPDIVVGSYQSSQAVLFRSRPVILVFPDIIFTPNQISIKQRACPFGGQNLTCVQVDACLWYTGKHVQSSLEFLFTLSVGDSRGFFNESKNRKSSIIRRQTLNVNEKSCTKFWLHLSPNAKDLLTPISVQFSNALVPSESERKKKTFDKNFPLYHPNIKNDITKKVPFHHGCGDDGICQSNLTVAAIRTDTTNNSVLTLGIAKSVSFSITVKNEGDPAYMSELHVTLSPGLSLAKDDVCDLMNKLNETNFVCDVGNPLNDDQQVEFHMKVDLSQIPLLTEDLAVKFLVQTKSKDMYLDDNQDEITLWFATVADFGVQGFSSHDQITYDKKSKFSPLITHTYHIRDYSPSPLRKIDFELQIPYAFLKEGERTPFLYLRGPKIDNEMQSPISTTCDASGLMAAPIIMQRKHEIVDDDKLAKSDVNVSETYVPASLMQRRSVDPLTDLEPEDFDQRADRNKSEILTAATNSISCDLNGYFECVTLRCSASSLTNVRISTKISMDFELDYEVLDDELENWYQFEFLTSGNASVDRDVQLSHKHPKEAHANTVITHEGPQTAKQISPWIIFVSIGVGALLLLVIFLILIKVGFFRRKDKDKMKELLYDAKKEEKNAKQEHKVEEEPRE